MKNIRTTVRKFRRSGTSLALALGVSLGANPAEVRAQSFNWTNIAGGNWNDGTNWNPIAPTFAAGADETLNFGGFLTSTTAGYTATNNLAIPAFTRVINFNNTFGSPTITVANTQTLTFNAAGGLNPSLNQNGFGVASINAFTLGASSPFTIGGSGVGNITLSGVITNTNNNAVTINQTGAGFMNTGAVVVLSGANNFGTSGATTINGGNVAVNNASAFGSTAANTITVNGGTFRANTTGLNLPNNWTLNSTLVVLNGNTTAATTFSGVLSGNGGLTMNPTGPIHTLALNNTSTFSGPVRLDLSPNSGSAVTLTGAAGQLTNVTNYTVMSNSVLTLDNSAGVNNTRLNPNANVSIFRGFLVHNGNATAGNTSSTTFNTLSIEGNATVQVVPGNNTFTGPGSTIAISTLARTNNGTLLLTVAPNLGAAPGTNNAVMTIANDPGGAIGGILPYAFANSGTSAATPVGTFVRYDDNTDRLVALNPATDYQAGALPLYLNPSATAQYRGVTTQAALPTATYNALSLDTTTTTVPFLATSVSGANALNVASGAIISTVSGSALPATQSTVRSTIATSSLNFGANPGYIHTFADLNIPAAITGSGGLVKSHTGALTLTGNNTFTGDVTHNGGALIVASDANLGNAGNSLRLGSGVLTAGAFTFFPTPLLTPGSATTLSTARAITFLDAGAPVAVTNSNNLMTFTGSVSGAGWLYKLGAGALFLDPTSGSNSYTGRTSMFLGVLGARSDAALGSTAGGGAPLEFVTSGAGIFQPLSSFTTNRNVLLSSTGTFFTNGNNLQINGVMGTQSVTTGIGMTKLGTGDLILTNTNTYNGATTVGTALGATGGGVVVTAGVNGTQTGGRLVLQGANGSAALSTGFTLNPGSALVLDNSAGVNNFRVGMVGQTHNGSELSLIGNATNGANTTQAIGAYNQNSLYNTITLNQPASTGTNNVTTLQAISYTPTAGTTFIRGNNLGGATGDRTAVILNTPAVLTPLTTGIIMSAVGATTANGAPTDFLTMTGNAVTVFNAYVPNNANAGVTNVTDITTASLMVGAGSTVAAARISGAGSVELAGNAWAVNNGGNGHLLTTNPAGTTITNAGLPASVNFGTTGRVTNVGDLTLGQNVTLAGTTINKGGAGALILNQANQGVGAPTTWNIGEGTLRYGTGVPTALATGATVTTAPGATLDLNNNTGVTLATLAGFGNVNVGTGSLSITGSSVFMGTFQGSGPITTTSTVTLSGNSSGFTGNWNVNASTLTVNSNAALGSGTINLGAPSSGTAGTLTVPTGAAVTQISNPIVVTATNTGTNVIASIAGTSVNFTGNVTHNGTGIFRLNGPTSSTAIPAGAWTLSGNLTGTGPLSWFGGNWNLNGNNGGFSGTVAIDNLAATVLGVGTDNALGTGTVTWTTSGGMLRADNGARTLANAIVVNGTANAFSMTGVNDITLTGPMTLNSTGTTNHNVNVINTGTTTFAGTISAVSATAPMSKTGFGDLVLSGTNTFAGGFALNSGALGFGSSSVGGTGTNGPVGTGTLSVNAANSNGAVLRAVGGARTVNNNVTVNGDFVVDGSNALTLGGTMALGAANRTIAVTNTANTTFGGVISGAAGVGITKQGTGTLIFPTGVTNTYSGDTNVFRGTLRVDGTLDAQTGKVFVGNSAPDTGTLRGTGTINRDVTVNSGGTLMPGASPGNLNVGGGVTLSSGAAFGFEYRAGFIAPAAYDTGGSGVFGTDNSHLTVTGNLSVDGAGSMFKIVGDFNDFLINQTYSFQVSTAATVSPFDVTNLMQFDTTQFAGFNPLSSLQWHNVGGVVYFNFTPVPEPVHVLLLCGGIAGAAGWWRRRK